MGIRDFRKEKSFLKSLFLKSYPPGRLVEHVCSLYNKLNDLAE